MLSYECLTPKARTRRECGIFFAFFLLPESDQGDNIHSIVFFPSRDQSPPLSLSLFLSLFLFLRGRRAPESALMKERKPLPSGGSFDARTFQKREREIKRDRRENEFSVTRSLSRYRLSLPLSPSTFSPEEEREHKKKQTNS